MFLRIISESFTRTPRRKFLTGAALALGMAVATATLTVALNVGDRLAAEFRSLGANLLVTPKADTLPLEVGGVDYRPVNAGAYLPVDDLPKLKQIFWRNNIKGFTPFLDVPITTLHGSTSANFADHQATLIGTWVHHKLKLESGEIFDTGVTETNPWWHIEDGGRWFNDDSNECVVGVALERREMLKIGDRLIVGTEPAFMPSAPRVELRVRAGFLSTGGPEDNAIVVPLAITQNLSAEPGKFRSLMVSAVVKPDDAFGRSDYTKLSGADYEQRWYCSAYIGSISKQIDEALPGVDTRAVRQVAEGEGKILGRVSALLWIVTLAALIAAGLAIGSTAATSVLERQKEVGLMKALGASNALVGAFFLGEQVLLALFGGGLGYAIGILLARWLSITVFGVASPSRIIMLPVTLGLSILVAVAGSIFPLRRASRFDPAPILRGE